MKFISAEEFLKQPREIQVEFLNWWQPSVGDLFCYYEKHKHNHIEVDCIKSKNILITIPFTRIFPLLTEGQLREFIEDKVESKISIIHEDNKFRIYTDSDLFGEYEKEYSGDYSILNALWNMAVETAKIVSREGEE